MAVYDGPKISIDFRALESYTCDGVKIMEPLNSIKSKTRRVEVSEKSGGASIMPYTASAGGFCVLPEGVKMVLSLAEGNAEGAAPGNGTAPGSAGPESPSEVNITSAELQAAARIRSTVEYALTGGTGEGTEGRPVDMAAVLSRHGFISVDSAAFVTAIGFTFDRVGLAAFAVGSGPIVAGVMFTPGGLVMPERWGAARVLYAYLNAERNAGPWIILDPGEGDAEAFAFAKELFLPAVEIARAYRAARDDGASETEAVESLAVVYLESPGAIAERVAELELT